MLHNIKYLKLNLIYYPIFHYSFKIFTCFRTDDHVHTYEITIEIKILGANRKVIILNKKIGTLTKDQ